MLLDLRARREYTELVVGLVAAVGAETDLIFDAVKAALEQVSYPTRLVHMIELLHEIERWESEAVLPHKPEEARIEKHMDAGDEFRSAIDSGDALAALGIGNVQKERVALTKNKDEPPRRQAYFFKSLKRSEELRLLREVYGSNFVALSAYSPRETRVSNLAARIARSHNSSDREKYREDAERLVNRDQKDATKSFGQDVRSTFPLADLFVDSSKPSEAVEQVRRFIELLFGNHFHTPTADEYAMAQASAAAMRSGSLSRQVGAVITNAFHDVIAVGTNEVPKFGGGQYWCSDSLLHRDIEEKVDSSDEYKRTNLGEIIDRLAERDWLAGSKKELSEDIRVNEALKLLSDTRVMQPLEYGRAVHAEMAALMDAARRGAPVLGGTLYTTTFPCHECARHIVGAGITRVVYIEPYPKSLAARLHDDSIVVDAEGTVIDKVRFEAFVGVAPRQYMNLFAILGERKDQSGKLLEWSARDSVLRRTRAPEAYIRNEDDALLELFARMKSAKLIPVQPNVK